MSRPFDLEAAKRGDPVLFVPSSHSVIAIEPGWTTPARIICFDRESNYPIVALAKMGKTFEKGEMPRYFFIDGTSGEGLLVMAPRKVVVEQWAMARSDGTVLAVRNTEMAAKRAAIMCTDLPSYYVVKLTGEYEE